MTTTTAQPAATNAIAFHYFARLGEVESLTLSCAGVPFVKGGVSLREYDALVVDALAQMRAWGLPVDASRVYSSPVVVDGHLVLVD
jgi:hypothetical protein